jgi:hypothetical protein
LQKKQDGIFQTRSLQDETIKLFRFVLSSPFEDWLRPKLKSHILTEFSEIFESFLIMHTSLISSVPLPEIMSIS